MKKIMLVVLALCLAACGELKEDKYLSCTLNGVQTARVPTTGYVSWGYNQSRSEGWVVGGSTYTPRPGEVCTFYRDPSITGE